MAYYQSGYADTENHRKIARDTIFRIYSMSKPVTGVAALILMERGQLSLEDPIEKWIPAFSKGLQVYVSGESDSLVTEPANRSVTIKDLMCHTSGFTYAIFGTHPCDKILLEHLKHDFASWFRNTSLEQLCEALANTPLSFQPGTSWHYGFSTDVLGYVVERVSGMSLRDFFQREIFGPLGMCDTDFYVPAEKIERLATCYDLKGPNHGFSASTSIERDRSVTPAMHSGGGGLVSTIDDYMLFSRMLLNGGTLNGNRLLQPETVLSMHSNHLPSGKDVSEMSFVNGFSETFGPGVGFGLTVSSVTDPETGKGCGLSGVGEYGWGGAASTWFQIDPLHNIAVVYMTQAIPSSLLPMRSHLRWLAHWVVADGSDDFTD